MLPHTITWSLTSHFPVGWGVTHKRSVDGGIVEMWWRWCWGVGEAKQGGQAKAKIAQKKRSFDPKTAQNCGRGGLRTPQNLQKIKVHMIYYTFYI